MADFFKKAAEDIKEGFDDLKDDVQKEAKKISAEHDAKEAEKKLKKAAENAKKDLKDGADKAVDAAKEKAADAVNAVKDKVNKTPGK